MAIVQVTQALLDLLRARHVYHSLGGGDRWPVGQRVGFEPESRIEGYSQVIAGFVLPAALGAFSYSRSDFRTNVQVGRYCSFGANITWGHESHPTDWVSTHPFAYAPRGLVGVVAQLRSMRRDQVFISRSYDSEAKPIRVGNDVWIGDRALVMSGLAIGDGAIVGAGAVVTHDVEPYAIVVGNPARVLRYRFDDAIVRRMLAVRWWRFAPIVLGPHGLDAPERFLDGLEAQLAGADPPPALDPPVVTGAEMLAAAES